MFWASGVREETEKGGRDDWGIIKTEGKGYNLAARACIAQHYMHKAMLKHNV